jgi:glutamyl-tRNA synthetase
VVRLNAPREGQTIVNDLLRGEISIENRMIDDYILVKSDGLALYHLAAMTDDHLMKITHFIRGSEWLPSLPLHALIHRAMGWEEPVWVHLSVFLKPSGKGKMSKREAADLQKDGYSIFIKDFEGLGYTPEAVNNWVALMGWSYDDHTEFFTLDDLIEKFDIHRLNPSPAAINFTKLDHFIGLHIRSLSMMDLTARIKPFFEEAGLVVNDRMLEKIIPIIQERIGTLDDAVEIAGFFFRDDVAPKIEDLIAKNLTASQSADLVRRACEVLERFD